MLRFTLNGTQIEIEDGENRTLLEYLRNVKCMKGTKEACSTGHCGACSVLVDGRLTRSCVTLVRRLDGKAVETIENAPNDTMLRVIQHSFLDVGAVQCGFCTPGMVMATKALLLHHPAPTEPEICDGLKKQLLPLHRLRQNYRGGQAGSGAAARGRSGYRQLPQPRKHGYCGRRKSGRARNHRFRGRQVGLGCGRHGQDRRQTEILRRPHR